MNNTTTPDSPASESPLSALESILQAKLAALPLDHPLRDCAVLDTETFYRTQKKADSENKTRKKAGQPEVEPCSVDPSGNWGYPRTPEWECYLVSAYAPAYKDLPEYRYSGPVSGVCWETLLARSTWLSHNRGFDKHAILRLVELKLAPQAIADACDVKVLPWRRRLRWHDTADLCTYSHLPRSLGPATSHRYGVKLDKGARDSMDGVRFSSLPADEQERIVVYAMGDAIAPFLIWCDLSPAWPEIERKISEHTGEIEIRGIPVDVARVEETLGVVEAAKFAVLKRIPWYGKDDENGKPYALRSKKALAEECLRAEVPVPKSTNQKDPGFLEWLDEYGDEVPCITDLMRFRRIDRLIATLRRLLASIRPDGRAALAMKYMGAEKTGRHAAGSKFNLLNQMKEKLYFSKADFGWLTEQEAREQEAFVIDMRALFTASPGNQLYMPDLSQIEPRVLQWILGNKVFLEACRSGLSPYEAHGKASGYEWEGKLKQAMPYMYALFKARVLALGYGSGWKKFINMARGYCKSEAEFLSIFTKAVELEQVVAFLDYLRYLTSELDHKPSASALREWETLDEQTRLIWVNSWLQVSDFRKKDPALCDRKSGLWAQLDNELKSSAKEGVYIIDLPSGRQLHYYGISSVGGWTARPGNPTAPPHRCYGGLLTENTVQAIARDVFCHGVINIEEAGYPVLFHVYDEAIVDAPTGTDAKVISGHLCRVPDWCADLPVDSECPVGNHYLK